MTYLPEFAAQAEALSLAAVLGILILAPWLAKEGGGLENFLELTVLLLLGLVSETTTITAIRSHHLTFSDSLVF